jgi:hypothetical protein
MVMFLYSVTFVTQPMAGMAPIDKIYTSSNQHHHGVHHRRFGWCGWTFGYQSCGHRHLQVRGQRQRRAAKAMKGLLSGLIALLLTFGGGYFYGKYVEREAQQVEVDRLNTEARAKERL